MTTNIPALYNTEQTETDKHRTNSTVQHNTEQTASTNVPALYNTTQNKATGGTDLGIFQAKERLRRKKEY